nr:leucine-rich repeat protein [Clostridiales bacterium]
MKRRFLKSTAVLLLIIALLNVMPLSSLANVIDENTLYTETVSLYQSGSLTTDYDDSQKDLLKLTSNYSTAVEKIVYAMKSLQKDIDITSYYIKIEDIKQIFEYCINNNPELFFIQRKINYYASNGYITRLFWEWNYSRAEINEMKERLEEVVTSAVSSVKNKEYSKIGLALKLHDYLTNLVTYDIKETNSNRYNSYGALVEHKAVCQGISLAYIYLLKQVGIECVMATSASMVHGWNMVNIDDKWYHIDVTWDAKVILDGNGNYKGKNLNYDYFLVSDKKLSADHNSWLVNIPSLSSFSTPKATTTTYDSYNWKNPSPSLIYAQADYDYTISNGTVTITKYKGSTKNVVVPSTIAGYTVTGCSVNAFSGNTSITSLTLPATIKSVWADSFKGCTSLKSLKMLCGGKHSLNFGSYGFIVDFDNSTITLNSINSASGSIIIPSVILGYNVTAIGENALKNNSAITSVALPSTVKTIGTMAFFSCTKLESVTLSSVKSIGVKAFANCSSLKNLTLPSTVTFIGSKAFSDCTKISYIEVPSGVADNYTLETTPFYNAVQTLKTSNFIYTIENNIATVKKYIGSLQNVTVPSTAFGFAVCGLADGCFEDNSTVKSITLPNAVSKIGANAFKGCSSLGSLRVAGDSSGDNMLPLALVELGEGCFDGTALTSMAIQNQLEFNGYRKTGEVYKGVFADSNIRTVELKDGIYEINEYLFAGCSSLQTVLIPQTVYFIGEGAFLDCISLNSVELPSELSGISENAFANCLSLEQITIPQNTSFYFSCKSAEPVSAFCGCANLKTVIFAEGRETVEQFFFKNCQGVESVTLPQSLKEIKRSAFYGCTSLNTINLPQRLEAIGQSAFEGCTQLQSVVLPSNLKTLGAKAFCNVGISYIEIPQSLKYT